MGLLSPSTGGPVTRQAAKPAKEPELPEVPADWLRELYDDLRVFGGECGPNCPDHS